MRAPTERTPVVTPHQHTYIYRCTLPLRKFHWKSTCLWRRPFVRYWDSGCVGWDFSKYHFCQRDFCGTELNLYY